MSPLVRSMKQSITIFAVPVIPLELPKDTILKLLLGFVLNILQLFYIMTSHLKDCFLSYLDSASVLHQFFQSRETRR